MLSSLLHSVCHSNNHNSSNSSLKETVYSSLLSQVLQPQRQRQHQQQQQQQQSTPSSSPQQINTSTISPPRTIPSSTMSLPISTISPPGSPPSPAMSMESIHDFQFDTAMQLARRKIKVMIVDDNSINLSILSRMLKVHFSETVELVAVMTSGLDALDRLNQEQIDLILMDIDMPVLTGVETTVAIRQITSEYPILKENQKVPIIAVTTSDHAVQREMYQRVGMCDCVSKPISLSKLRLAIENAITLMGHIAPG